MLGKPSSAEPKLIFDRLVLRCDKSDEHVVNALPWNWSLCAGERLSVMSSNSFLMYQMMAILSGFVQPVSGDFRTFGSLSWPLGGEGGLDGKLTISNALEFLSSIYDDCLDKSLVSVDEFYEVLQSRSIDSRMRLKELSKDKKDFFYLALSILFSFDIYVVPRSKYLTGKDARPLRALLHQQLCGGQSIVSATTNNRFRRDFCNRGLVLGSSGEILFHGDLEDAIAYERDNVKITSQIESDENQLDMAHRLSNSDSTSDQDDGF